MKTVELYARVRHAVLSEGLSERAAADRFGINARTVLKMLKFSVSPGCVRRKGNDKGKVEGLVGYARRNFLVSIPVFADFAALNAHLLEGCRKRLANRLHGHDGTIGERLEQDLAAFQKPLPAPYDACDKTPASVNSLSLVRYRLNDYSVRTAYGTRRCWSVAMYTRSSSPVGPR